MKIRRMLPLLALALLAALAMGCNVPDYQLDFHDVSVSSFTESYATVAYSLSNVGSQQLINATVCIEVLAPDNSQLGTAWTNPVTLDVGETAYGTIEVFLYPSGTYASLDAYVIEAGWDNENNSSLFNF
jgi:hypothetical protein